jgi:hypothetical protein
MQNFQKNLLTPSGPNNSGGVYFIPKMKIFQRPQILGVPWALRATQIKKLHEIKGFNFRWFISCKNAYFQKIPLVTHSLRPQYFGPPPKKSKFGCVFFRPCPEFFFNNAIYLRL